MKKSTVIIFILILILAFLAGCSGAAPSAGNAGSSESSNPETIGDVITNVLSEPQCGLGEVAMPQGAGGVLICVPELSFGGSPEEALGAGDISILLNPPAEAGFEGCNQTYTGGYTTWVLIVCPGMEQYFSSQLYNYSRDEITGKPVVGYVYNTQSGYTYLSTEANGSPADPIFSGLVANPGVSNPVDWENLPENLIDWNGANSLRHPESPWIVEELLRQAKKNGGKLKDQGDGPSNGSIKIYIAANPAMTVGYIAILRTSGQHLAFAVLTAPLVTACLSPSDGCTNLPGTNLWLNPKDLVWKCAWFLSPHETNGHGLTRDEWFQYGEGIAKWEQIKARYGFVHPILEINLVAAKPPVYGH